MVEDKNWLHFEFSCVKGKTEEVLETLHGLGNTDGILDSPIRGVAARWSEIINGSVGEVGWKGTHISGTCMEGYEPQIVDAISRVGAVESGNDYYLNRIHFWDLSQRRHARDFTVESSDSY